MRTAEIWGTKRFWGSMRSIDAMEYTRRKWENTHPNEHKREQDADENITVPEQFRCHVDEHPSGCRWIWKMVGYSVIDVFHVTQNMLSADHYYHKLRNHTSSPFYNLTKSAIGYLTNYHSTRKKRRWARLDPNNSYVRQQITVYLCNRLVSFATQDIDEHLTQRYATEYYFIDSLLLEAHTHLPTSSKHKGQHGFHSKLMSVQELTKEAQQLSKLCIDRRALKDEIERLERNFGSTISDLLRILPLCLNGDIPQETFNLDSFFKNEIAYESFNKTTVGQWLKRFSPHNQQEEKSDNHLLNPWLEGSYTLNEDELPLEFRTGAYLPDNDVLQKSIKDAKDALLELFGLVWEMKKMQPILIEVAEFAGKFGDYSLIYNITLSKSLLWAVTSWQKLIQKSVDNLGIITACERSVLRKNTANKAGWVTNYRKTGLKIKDLDERIGEDKNKIVTIKEKINKIKNIGIGTYKKKLEQLEKITSSLIGRQIQLGILTQSDQKELNREIRGSTIQQHGEEKKGRSNPSSTQGSVDMRTQERSTTQQTPPHQERTLTASSAVSSASLWQSGSSRRVAALSATDSPTSLGNPFAAVDDENKFSSLAPPSPSDNKDVRYFVPRFLTRLNTILQSDAFKQLKVDLEKHYCTKSKLTTRNWRLVFVEVVIDEKQAALQNLLDIDEKANEQSNFLQKHSYESKSDQADSFYTPKKKQSEDIAKLIPATEGLVNYNEDRGGYYWCAPKQKPLKDDTLVLIQAINLFNLINEAYAAASNLNQLINELDSVKQQGHLATFQTTLDNLKTKFERFIARCHLEKNEKKEQLDITNQYFEYLSLQNSIDKDIALAEEQKQISAARRQQILNNIAKLERIKDAGKKFNRLLEIFGKSIINARQINIKLETLKKNLNKASLANNPLAHQLSKQREEIDTITLCNAADINNPGLLLQIDTAPISNHPPADIQGFRNRLSQIPAPATAITRQSNARPNMYQHQDIAPSPSQERKAHNSLRSKKELEDWFNKEGNVSASLKAIVAWNALVLHSLALLTAATIQNKLQTEGNSYDALGARKGIATLNYLMTIAQAQKQGNNENLSALLKQDVKYAGRQNRSTSVTSHRSDGCCLYKVWQSFISFFPCGKPKTKTYLNNLKGEIRNSLSMQ